MILTTHRLMLVACPLEVAQALLCDPPAAERSLGAEMPAGWPHPALRKVIPLYLQEILHDPASLGWGIWIAIDRAQNAVVGDAGFKGRPNHDGTVEIGYGIAPAHRDRGYATEAVRSLVDWAFTHPEVKRVVAECAPDNPASTRVLDKSGFRLTDRTNESLYWEIAPRI